LNNTNREYYGFIELLRDVDAPDNAVEQDLKRLAEFVRYRASRSKSVEYYIVTMMRKDVSEGLVIVKGVEKAYVDYEIELLLGFIESSCSALEGRVLNSITTKNTEYLPIPIIRNF